MKPDVVVLGVRGRGQWAAELKSQLLQRGQKYLRRRRREFSVRGRRARRLRSVSTPGSPSRGGVVRSTEARHRPVSVRIDGRDTLVPEGVSVAAALLSPGVEWSWGIPSETGIGGIFCGMGACYGCVAKIDGRRGVRTCITPVIDGMRIDAQWRPDDD